MTTYLLWIQLGADVLELLVVVELHVHLLKQKLPKLLNVDALAVAGGLPLHGLEGCLDLLHVLVEVECRVI